MLISAYKISDYEIELSYFVHSSSLTRSFTANLKPECLMCNL